MLSTRTRAGVAMPMVFLMALLAALAVGAPATAGDHGRLPEEFRWVSTGPLIGPKPDATHPIVSIKDPTVVRHGGKWHVFATTANTSGNWSLVYLNFRNWSEAADAPHHYLDQNPGIGTGYRAAPQVFYFAPQRKWYLIYQTGLPSYSTTDDISRPESWTAPRNFQETMPDIVRDNIGNGFWLDFWVVCDRVNCYLYSSDDNGQLYRARTTVAEFPDGFDDTEIVMQDPDRFRLFEAANVYRLKGTNNYLLLVEAIGTDGRRYFRSWTSRGLDGQWQPLADSEANPFARSTNVTFRPGVEPWTEDISHGEMLRDGIDQTLTIDPCHMRFLYQGMDPAASGDYSQLPWRLGLLSQVNSPCRR